MGGVDMMDQQLDAIGVLRKSYKWYKKLSEAIDAVQSISTKLYKLQGVKDDLMYVLIYSSMHQD